MSGPALTDIDKSHRLIEEGRALVGDDAIVEQAHRFVGDYEGEESRYAIYVVSPTALRSAESPEKRRRLAETSLDGIGMTLATLRDEDEIGDDSRVGIFDRLLRVWIVNPWAKGDLR